MAFTKKNTLIYLILSIYFFITISTKPVYGATKNKLLKIGTLPTTASILLYVAADEDIFTSYGLNVEIIPFRSTMELNSAMRAGTLDGQFTDIISVLMQNETGIPQKIVVNALCSTPHSRNFGIAVPYNSPIKKIDDLKKHSIAISKATIIDYLFTKFLEESHISREECTIIDINRLIMRMQMLLANKVDAALLVEPLLSLVELKGAHIIVDDHELNMILAVIALTPKNTTPIIAEPFRNSILDAAARVNANPQKYQKFMVKKGIVPKELINTLYLPLFNIEKKPIPTPEDIEFFASWMIRSKYLHSYPQYKNVVLQ